MGPMRAFYVIYIFVYVNSVRRESYNMFSRKDIKKLYSFFLLNASLLDFVMKKSGQ